MHPAVTCITQRVRVDGSDYSRHDDEAVSMVTAGVRAREHHFFRVVPRERRNSHDFSSGTHA
jgi:hypothetical protein